MSIINLVTIIKIFSFFVSFLVLFIFSPLSVQSLYATEVITEFSIPTGNSNPYDITAGPDGNVWFAEAYGNKIGRITPQGDITEFPIPTNESNPLEIIAGPDDHLWFTETYATKIGRISPEGVIEEFTLGSGAFSITSGPDGNVWFTQPNVNKIGRITPQGTVTEFLVPTELSQPKYITSGPDGNLWFTEIDGSKIGRITPQGVITEFPTLTNDSSPNIITSGFDGNLWFTEGNANRISRITPQGDIDGFEIPTNEAIITSMVAGPDGNVWFAEGNGNKIGKITPQGTIKEFPIPDSSISPFYIIAGPDGNIWFSEPSGNSIGRITPQGIITEYAAPTADSYPFAITAGPDDNIWFTGASAGKIGRVDIFNTPPIPPDQDGDGILNEREVNGLTVDPDGGGPISPQFIDLPAMGADPNKPDIFIQIDWMDDDDHSHKLSQEAIREVVDAFANSSYVSPNRAVGINLHVDQGPDSVLNFSTGATWGTLSKARSLFEVTPLGSHDGNNYNWTTFQAIKDSPQGFTNTGRTAVFHYVISAHHYGDTTSSGISRNQTSSDSEFIKGASDFIVSLGSFTNGVGTINEQAGTFMHELGHNLGLRHGGGDHINRKPNYLSVMNYSFQMGLSKNIPPYVDYDYSRTQLPTLDETNLNETTGLGPDASDYGTGHACFGSILPVLDATMPIDWNCDGDRNDTNVRYDINGEGGDSQQLEGHEDWSNITFNGGAIGDAGILSALPIITKDDEATKEELDAIQTLSYLTSLNDAKIWVGIENILSLGIKLDLKAEVYKGSTLITSGQVNGFYPGASGLFITAKNATIPFETFSPVDFVTGSELKLTLSVRNACSGSSRNHGKARLWYNDDSANSKFGATINNTPTDYFLRNNFLLATTAGSGSKKTIDVEAGSKCSPFKPFGTWTITR